MTSEPSDTETREAEGVGEDATAALELLRAPELAEPLEDLTKLLSHSIRAFLMGAGCSKCAGLPLMVGLTEEVLEEASGQQHGVILGDLATCFKGSTAATIEDYMSELSDLISIAERRRFRGANAQAIPLGEHTYSTEELRRALDSIKTLVAKVLAGHNANVDCHREFVRAVHGRLQAGRSGQQGRVDYFTLNYDTLLEDALSLERVPATDGFAGGVTAWWQPNLYDDPNARARVFKLHGSVDWCRLDEDVLPRRVRPEVGGERRDPVMIWPAGTKYREAQRDPFAQVLGMMRGSLRPDQKREIVLAVVGYSFGDQHINYELDRALQESDGRLTVLVLTSEATPTGLPMTWLKDPSLREHVRIHASHGFYHGDSEIRSDTELPWWRFEVLTRLLGGER